MMDALQYNDTIQSLRIHPNSSVIIIIGQWVDPEYESYDTRVDGRWVHYIADENRCGSRIAPMKIARRTIYFWLLEQHENLKS